MLFADRSFYIAWIGIFDVFCSRDFDLDPMTFIFKLDPYFLEIYIGWAKRNFLYVNAFGSYPLTDRQTDTTEIVYHAASLVVNDNSCGGGVIKCGHCCGRSSPERLHRVQRDSCHPAQRYDDHDDRLVSGRTTGQGQRSLGLFRHCGQLAAWFPEADDEYRQAVTLRHWSVTNSLYQRCLCAALLYYVLHLYTIIIGTFIWAVLTGELLRLLVSVWVISFVFLYVFNYLTSVCSYG